MFLTGGMPFYPGMPYGVPVVGPQRHQAYQQYPPQMPYPYMIEPVPQGNQQQNVQTIMNQQTDSSSLAQQTSKSVQAMAVNQTGGTTAAVTEKSQSQESEIFQVEKQSVY